MVNNVKQAIKGFLRRFNIDVRRISRDVADRPVGQMETLLEDLRNRDFKCTSVIDVGANRTVWSSMAKKVFPAANFYLIEPQTELEPLLIDFCNQYSQSRYFLAGAGAEKGELTFTVWEDLAGSSFLPPKDGTAMVTGKQRVVPVITINDLINVEGVPMPDMMKLDVQGFELEVLKGADQTFGNCEVYILETSLFPFENNMPVFYDVVKFMHERGYVVYDFPGFLRRPLDGALGQCDICFVKENGFLRRSHAWAK